MEFTEQIDTRYGPFNVTLSRDLICESLRRYGEWAQTEIDVLRKFIGPGDIVLDVGAYIGTHARAFSTFVGEGGKVHAFEPQSAIFDVLLTNVNLSEQKNIIPHQFALGQSIGRGSLLVQDSQNLGATSVRYIKDAEADAATNSVRVSSIDGLHLERVDFIKMDAEGSEYKILEGAGETIARCAPTIFLEINALDAIHDVFSLTSTIEYDCFGVLSHSFNRHNFNSSSQDIFVDGASECGILLIDRRSRPEQRIEAAKLGLPELASVDDLCLLLLQKAQYPSEVLKKARAASGFPVPLIDVGGKATARLEGLLKEVTESRESLERTLTQREASIRQLTAQLKSRDSSVAFLKARLSERDSSIASLSASMAALQSSYSWRMTAPLRATKEFLSTHIRPTRRNRSGKHEIGDAVVYVRPLHEDADSHIFIEEAHYRGLALRVRGWFFNENARTLRGSITVVSRRLRQTFPLIVGRNRGDVASAWGNAAARQSGFLVDATLKAEGGTPLRLELAFDVENAEAPLAYEVGLQAEKKRQLRVARHVVRRLTLRRMKIGLHDLIRGRFDTLWLRANHVFQTRHDREPKRPPSQTHLCDALFLISDSPLPRPREPGPVDIIIPVYNGLSHLDPLFASLKRNTSPQHRVIIVDDASPDERVQARLAQFAESRENVVLLRLEQNHGFAGAVNRGAERAEHDFVLLNTDVVVAPGWLERLMAPLGAYRSIATVTPFSNAATVCSFPIFCTDNEIFAELPVDRIDHWFSRVHVEKIDRDLPTGVGFCMAINRDIWRQIGPFDEDAFCKGYGEENDWCLRAKALGYRNVIAANLFAYHKHGGTFESSNREVLRRKALETINRRYPDYDQIVRTYCEQDPLRPLREILSVVIAGNEAALPPVLVIDQQIGGGANQYRDALIGSVHGKGHPVLILLLDESEVIDENRYTLYFRFRHYHVSFGVESNDDIIRLMTYLPIGEIVLNNIVSAPSPASILALVRALKEKTGGRLVIPIHDFYPLCPSYTLLNAAAKYCSLPDVIACSSCLPVNAFAANPERKSVEEWRREWGSALRMADEIVCFSNDSEEKVLRVFPESAGRLVVRPHSINVKFARRPTLASNSALHVGVVGAIGPEKGSNVVVRLAEEMLANDPEARITVIGRLAIPLELPNLRVTGPYQRAMLPDLLEEHGISLCLLPSIWPETFSYVAEELMTLGVPLAVFDLGAPAERVRKYRLGIILDVSLIEDPTSLYRHLVDFHHDIQRLRTRSRTYA